MTGSTDFHLRWLWTQKNITKMTVIFQNNRYSVPKWPLFFTEMTVIQGVNKLSVILVGMKPKWLEMKPKWPLFEKTTKMTVVHLIKNIGDFGK